MVLAASRLVLLLKQLLSRRAGLPALEVVTIRHLAELVVSDAWRIACKNHAGMHWQQAAGTSSIASMPFFPGNWNVMQPLD